MCFGAFGKGVRDVKRITVGAVGYRITVQRAAYPCADAQQIDHVPKGRVAIIDLVQFLVEVCNVMGCFGYSPVE